MAGTANDDPLLGKILSGRFQVVEPLGVGGMGRVYKAIQQPLDRIVAIKVLSPRHDRTKDPGFERRFFLEASMTAKLKHPNTITVHDYGRTEDGIYFIAMEYLEGETLQSVINREKRLHWQRVLTIGAQIARSLREAHKLGLVHRDLKPGNVMLLAEGSSGDTVKVLDFGLVKAFASDVVDPADLEITQAGVLLGSPLYMAPEQARGETDQRTDIYSLGVLLFHCLAGQPPFRGNESIDIIVKHVKEPPPELRSLVTDVPNEVNDLIMRCLSKRPEDRYQTMDELLEAMRIAVSGQGLSGLFVDPRTFSSQAIPAIANPFRRSSNGVHIASPAELPPPLPRPPPLPKEALDEAEELDILVEDPSRSKWSNPLILGAGLVVVLGVLVGGSIAFRALRRPEPAAVIPRMVEQAQDKPGEGHERIRLSPPSEPAEQQVEVVFDVESEPPGAVVTQDGTVVGTTPFSLRVVRTDAEPARAELAFDLEGYHRATMVAQGSSGHVPIKSTLKKKPVQIRVVKPKPVKNTSPEAGYKDDPYQ